TAFPYTTLFRSAHDFAARVGQWPAGISRREKYFRLHPVLRAQPAKRANAVNYARRKRADKAHGIADGNGQFAGAHLRRIGDGSRREIHCIDAKLGEIAPRIARLDRGLEFASIPQLDGGPRAAYHG